MNNLCNRCQNNTEEGTCLKGQSQFTANLENNCNFFKETVAILNIDDQAGASLVDVINIIHMIQQYPKDTIVIRRDSAESLSAAYNPNRAKLLIYLEDIFTKDIFDSSDSDFFYNYLQSLQPFMYIKSIISEDSESDLGIYHQMLHIFEYPCGTQSIQIKVCVKDGNIVLISFHQGAPGIESLSNRYRKTIALFGGTKDYLLFMTEKIRIWIDHIYLDIFADDYDRQSCCYFSSLESFFSCYREAFASVLNSILEGYAANLVLGLKSKVSIYSAISMAEFGYNRNLLSEKGKLHALASLRSLLGCKNSAQLNKELTHLLTTVRDTNGILDWLMKYELPGGIEGLLTLTTKEDDIDE